MERNDDMVCTIDYNGKKWRQCVHGGYTSMIRQNDQDEYSDDLYECFGE